MAMSNIAEPKITDTTVTHLPNLHAGIKLPYPKYDRRKITEDLGTQIDKRLMSQ